MIFFFDLDGTLLYHKQWCVPASAVRTLQLLHKSGHRLYLNTSRSPQEMINAEEALKKIPFDGAILTGGALTQCGGKTVRELYAPMEPVKRAIEKLNEWQVPFRWQSGEELHYSADPGTETKVTLGWLFGGAPTVKSWNGEKLMRLVCYLMDEQIEMMTNLLPELRVAPQGHTLVNITALQVDKAEAMQIEAARLGYAREETVAFGDGLNDVDMLKTAGYGIALGNCKESVSLAADYTTTPIQEDGIMNAVRHFGWI